MTPSWSLGEETVIKLDEEYEESKQGKSDYNQNGSSSLQGFWAGS